MTIEEIRRYIEVGRGHQVCVDLRLAPEFPGFVRRVVLRDQGQVVIEFEEYGWDEAGAYFYGQYPNLEQAVQDLEAFLQSSVRDWKNVTLTGDYPSPTSHADAQSPSGGKALMEAIAAGTVPLPHGVPYELRGGSFWRRMQRG
jgi:hypothetical protein